VEALTQSVCDLALGFGEGDDDGKDKKKKKMSRPFGVALLMAGYDAQQGSQLYFSDPSGTYLLYKAKAIGAGSEGAQSTLQEKYRGDMTLRDAEDLALEVLKQVMEDKLNNLNVEMGIVTQQVLLLSSPASSLLTSPVGLSLLERPGVG
jgi:20S proteasome subunit alpha 5